MVYSRGLFLFNINDLNSEKKLPDDTKLSVTVHITERRDDTQRDLKKLEKCALVNIMRFNNAKCKMLQFSWGKLIYV